MAQVADKLAHLKGWHGFGREKGGVVERPSAYYI